MKTDTRKLKAVLEAVLFASGEPLDIEKTAKTLLVDKESIVNCLGEIKEEYDGKSKAELIEQAAGMSRALMGKIPTLRSSATNLNIAPSPINYDMVIELTFDDMAGMGEFHVHPLHMELVKHLDSSCEALAAVDYEF